MHKKSTINYREKGHFSLYNDCGDLCFAVVVGKKTPDGWAQFHCELQILDCGSSQLKAVYSSENNSVVSEIHRSELVRLSEYCSAIQNSKQADETYQSETKEFKLKIIGTGDIYQVTTTVDLNTMSPEKLESGPGEAEMSLFFKCTLSEISKFSSEINQWLQGASA